MKLQKPAVIPPAKRPKSGQRSFQLDKATSDPNPKFEFEYSERYNLKRLPPEEAAAIRKKLEAEGH